MVLLDYKLKFCILLANDKKKKIFVSNSFKNQQIEKLHKLICLLNLIDINLLRTLLCLNKTQ